MKGIAFIGLFLSVFFLSAKMGDGLFIMEKGGKALFTTTAENGDKVSGKCESFASILRADEGNLNIAIPVNGFEFEEAGLIEQFKSADYLNYKKSDALIFNCKMEGFEIGKLKEGIATDFKMSGEIVVAGNTNSVDQTISLSLNGKNIKGNTTFDINLDDFGIELDDAMKAKFGNSFTLSCYLEWATLEIKTKEN